MSKVNSRPTRGFPYEAGGGHSEGVLSLCYGLKGEERGREGMCGGNLSMNDEHSCWCVRGSGDEVASHDFCRGSSKESSTFEKDGKEWENCASGFDRLGVLENWRVGLFSTSQRF